MSRTAIAAVGVMAALLVTALASAPHAQATGSSRALIDRMNGVRAGHGLPPLRRSASLSRSSFRFARWLVVRDVFGHASRIQASSRFRRLGEALAYQYGWRLRARSILRRLLGSPAHRGLILSSGFRYVGVGHKRGRYGRRMATVWVVHLGTR